MGEWYATALFWKPQIALLVNESTLLPVLMPLAQAATLATRIGQQIITVRTAKTANRSVLGVMNEFTHLAEAYRDTDPGPDLPDLALRLATTPCGPLYHPNVRPD